MLIGVSPTAGSTIIPSVRYRDAYAAIEWLVGALGFERHAVYPGLNHTVAHAQLTFGGTGMVMLGSADNAGEGAKWTVQPDEIGLRETVGINLIAPDAEAVYARAKAAGAEMVFDLRDMDYGGRAFCCRDPEGHLWSVGSYNPWLES